MPSAPLLQLAFCYVCLPTFVAEVCVGSLLSDVGFDVTVSFAERMLPVLASQMCHLAYVLPFLWHIGGPSNDPGALGSPTRGNMGPRRRFLMIWDGFRAHRPR